jgi:broad specificity phosphatase PhoE
LFHLLSSPTEFLSLSPGIDFAPLTIAKWGVMTQIILVRHGETEWNAQEIFRGRRDVALNEMGVKQAKQLGGYLKDLQIEAIYSSPLQRALDTAKPIAGPHGLDVLIAPGLTDINYGTWEGLTHQDVQSRYGGLYERWRREPHLVKIPDGETLGAVRERAGKVVAMALSQHPGTVVLVSHRVVNKVLICSLLGLDDAHFWNIRQDLGGITIFAHEDGRFILIKHNDTSYFRPVRPHALGDF